MVDPHSVAPTPDDADEASLELVETVTCFLRAYVDEQAEIEVPPEQTPQTWVCPAQQLKDLGIQEGDDFLFYVYKGGHGKFAVMPPKSETDSEPADSKDPNAAINVACLHNLNAALNLFVENCQHPQAQNPAPRTVCKSCALAFAEHYAGQMTLTVKQETFTTILHQTGHLGLESLLAEYQMLKLGK